MGHIKETGFKGGVKLVDNADQAKAMAKEFLGNHLVTKQAPDGLVVNSVYLVEKINIAKELYLSVTLDRKAGCPTFIFSPEGGMSIEDVAESNPEKIFKLQAHPGQQLNDADLRKAAGDLGIAEQAD